MKKVMNYSGIVVPTRQVLAVEQALDRAVKLHHRKNPCHALISGDSGCGKTTAIEYYYEKNKPTDLPEKTICPVLVVSLRTGTSVGALLRKMLKALGDPLWSKGSNSELEDRLFERIRTNQIKLIIIDEAHNLLTARSMNKSVATVIKTIANDTDAAIAVFGTRELLRMRDDEELSRRFTTIQNLKFFSYDPRDENDSFTQFVYEMSLNASSKDAEYIRRTETVHRLFLASRGRPGVLAHLINFAGLEKQRRGGTLSDHHFFYGVRKHGDIKEIAWIFKHDDEVIQALIQNYLNCVSESLDSEVALDRILFQSKAKG